MGVATVAMDDLLDLDFQEQALSFDDFSLALDAQTVVTEQRCIELTSETSSSAADESAGAEEVSAKRSKKRELPKKAAAPPSPPAPASPEAGEDDSGVMENSNIRYNPATRKGNAFAFSKQEVARMTPADLDAYEQQVSAHHAMTADEEALLKKYRRQVRNRASAQNSRARKRQHTEQLEDEVSDLKKRNAALDSKLGEADKEVRGLRERVHYLEGILDARAIPYNKARVSAGVLALVLVFSFGLFFPLNLSSAGQHQDPAMAAAPQSRQLLDQTAVAVPVVANPVLQPVAALPPVVARQEGPPPGRVRIVDHDSALVPAEGVLSSPFVRRHEKDLFPQWDRPNTDYLFCPTAHHVLSTKKEHSDEPSRISLLLPTDVFNGTMDAFRVSGAPMVEVTCSVLDIFPVFFSGSQQQHMIEGAVKQ